jgi:plasmid stability protein
MSNLSIRKLDKQVYAKLKIRAVRHGISMEEEVRQIISQAVDMPEKISAVFKKYFGSKNGIDLHDVQRRKPHEPMDFDE